MKKSNPDIASQYHLYLVPMKVWTEIPYYTVYRFTSILYTLPQTALNKQWDLTTILHEAVQDFLLCRVKEKICY